MNDVPGAFELPHTLWGLYVMITLTLLSVVVGFIRGIRQDQLRIVEQLGQVAANEARVAQALDLILGQLLERALREPVALPRKNGPTGAVRRKRRDAA
jgi:hypothetical protein